MGRAPSINFGPYWWVFVLIFLIGLCVWIWYRWSTALGDDEEIFGPLTPEEEDEYRHLLWHYRWGSTSLTPTQFRRLDYLEGRKYGGHC